jgi:Zn-dependent protease
MGPDFFVLLPVLIFSIVVHEVAHAWQARREGDQTAEKLGRITLNPVPHVDPIGSLVVPLLLYFGNTGFLFGWAKPVPVDPRNYRDYRWGDVRVSLAGIVSNLALATLFTLLAALLAATGLSNGAVGQLLGSAAFYGIQINLLLAIFNLIPIPPLDGSHVVFHMLPPRLAIRYQAMGRYGILVLMAMLFLVPEVFGVLMAPVELLSGVAARFILLWA